MTSHKETLEKRIENSRKRIQESGQKDYIIELSEPSEVIAAQQGGLQNVSKRLRHYEMRSARKTECKRKKSRKVKWSNISSGN